MELIDRIKQINWKQTKFMLPAILYIPLMGGSYFIFDLFHMEKAELPDKTLQTTEFLNPELPDAQIKMETELATSMRTWQSPGVKYRTIQQWTTLNGKNLKKQANV